jgi:hypothetical protein
MVVVNHFPNQLNQTEKVVNPSHVVGGTHSHLFMPTIQTHPKCVTIRFGNTIDMIETTLQSMVTNGV